MSDEVLKAIDRAQSMSEIHYNIGMDRYERDGVPVSAEHDALIKRMGIVAYLKEVQASKELEDKLPPAFAKITYPAGYAAMVDELTYKIWVGDAQSGHYEKSSTPFPISNYRQAAVDMVEEILSARKAHGPMHSAHHGYAIMLEEMDEVKEHVWIKQKNRDQAKLRKELIQLGAMAIAMAVEIADADNRK